jgi:hypothetical protein
MTYDAVLVEWDDDPFAKKRFVVWTETPAGAGAFAQEWLDYVDRVGVAEDVEISTRITGIRLEEDELERLWPRGVASENLTGYRASKVRDVLNLRGPWRRARILWERY